MMLVTKYMTYFNRLYKNNLNKICISLLVLILIGIGLIVFNYFNQQKSTQVTISNNTNLGEKIFVEVKVNKNTNSKQPTNKVIDGYFYIQNQSNMPEKQNWLMLRKVFDLIQEDDSFQYFLKEQKNIDFTILFTNKKYELANKICFDESHTGGHRRTQCYSDPEQELMTAKENTISELINNKSIEVFTQKESSQIKTKVMTRAELNILWGIKE